MDLFFLFGGISCLCTWGQSVYFCTQEAFSSRLNGCFSGHNNKLLTLCLSCTYQKKTVSVLQLLKPHQFNFLLSCSKVRKIQNSTLLLFIIQTKKENMIFHLGIIFLTLHYWECLRTFLSYSYVLNACISPSINENHA